MSIDVLEIVFFSIFLLIFSLLSVNNVKTRLQNKKLKANL
jgi:hypothetical protein